MGFKRKHSTEDSSLSIASFRAFSISDTQPIPALAENVEFQTNTRSNAWDFASASRVKSSEWGNRTRKRVRDSRPDERAIHENTLNKLYAAQRNHLDVLPMQCDAPVEQPTMPVSKPQKSTLHSFWKQLPAPPVQPVFSAPAQQDQTRSQLPRCDDCDTPLQTGTDSLDVDMDVDMDMGGNLVKSPFACNDCGKNVCCMCAVVSTNRHCLQCATSGRNSRRWW